MKGVVEKINNGKDKLVVVLWITSQKLGGDKQLQTEMIEKLRKMKKPPR